MEEEKSEHRSADRFGAAFSMRRPKMVAGAGSCLPVPQKLPE